MRPAVEKEYTGRLRRSSGRIALYTRLAEIRSPYLPHTHARKEPEADVESSRPTP